MRFIAVTARTTRGYSFFWRWPLWRASTRYDKPINWFLFRVWDFVPLAVFMVAAAWWTTPAWVATVLALVYFVWFPVMFTMRLLARQRFCATQGHTPYRPVPEVDEWECIYCGSSLRMRDPTAVATAVANEAAKLNVRRHRTQAYWSDRR